MSGKAERLQDAIGLISDEYVEEAHGAQDAGEQAEATQGQGAAQDAAGAATASELQDGGAKVVQVPARQRKRRKAAVPIAVAACLVLAIGAGALAFTNMSAPLTDEAAEKVEYLEDPRSIMAAESATEADGMAATAEPRASASEADGAAAPDAPYYTPGIPDYNRAEGEAFVLTAGEWNDNLNWPFFMNLVNSNTVSFPVFGLDPTHRVKVTLTDTSGNPVRGEAVELLGESGEQLWNGVSDKDGTAYLFYREGQLPAKVSAGGMEQYLAMPIEDPADQQGAITAQVIGDVELVVDAAPAPGAGLQVMFIVDTTGSMSDEIAYLQKDFASIAEDVGSDGVEYSVNFYRDEGDDYVTKCNGFTGDVATVQALLNKEYADGGGDTPEAVADILAETITGNRGWRDDCNKVAFLIFDAPPHEGADAVLDGAVRSAAERGIKLVPVVASNADRETELFGRALAIMTCGTYVFLTDDSGVGDSHLEPIIGDYSVELLHDVIVRTIQDNR